MKNETHKLNPKHPSPRDGSRDQWSPPGPGLISPKILEIHF